MSVFRKFIEAPFKNAALKDDEKALEDAFANAFTGGAGAPVRFQGTGPFNPGPSLDHIECARRVLLKLIEQADSIIADPEDLAKRAWAIADAMQQQEKERCK